MFYMTAPLLESLAEVEWSEVGRRFNQCSALG